MEYKITEDILKATLSYLASKPFAEVAQLIQSLQSSEKIEDKTKQKEVK